MSRFSLSTLHDIILRGITAAQGMAWWYDATTEAARIAAGKEPSHYEGPVPFGAVERLFNRTVDPILIAPSFTFTDAQGNVRTVTDDTRRGVLNRVNGSVFYVGSDGYNPHEYVAKLLRETSAIVSGTLRITSAGVFDDGAEAFVSVAFPETVEIHGAHVHPYLLRFSSLNGKRATGTKPVATLVECDNTYDAALSERSVTHTEKHTRHSNKGDDESLDEIRAAVGIALETVAESFTAKIDGLVKQSVSDDQWKAFLSAYVPIPEQEGRGKTMAETKRDTLSALYGNDSRVAPWRGTAFGVLQATNTYAQHYAIVRSGDDNADKAAVRAIRNLQNTLSGKVAESDDNAMSILRNVLSNA